ncbi:hypothetical protein GOODEAATRI_027440, partial [Goodea atripinnis]
TPPPAKLTATPLGDSSMEVRWTSPPDLSLSGFVVEWFAVREKTSSILHWEKLNSSCTRLVIAGSRAVEHIYGSSVELSWSPVPVELLNGFIRNVTIFYITKHRPANSE